MRVVPLLLALTGCSQIFGLDSPRLGDAAVSDTRADGMPSDGRVDAHVPGDAMVTLTFQDGIGGYAAETDTYIDFTSTSTSRAGDSVLRYRTGDRWALLQFQSIFGQSAIPTSAVITSAVLTISFSNNNCNGMINDVATSWSDSATFDTFGASPGVNSDDVGASDGAVPTINGMAMIDVTASLKRWVADPSTNHGWIFTASGGGGECVIRSAEDGFTANRPKLTVTFAQ